MPKIAVDGLNFHYWQSGQGADLILVHGLGGNLAGWHLTMVPDLQQTYRVTTYDLRGHGRSDAPLSGYTTRDMAEDLKGLMDARGIERAHIVGHSWGGDIALHFALLYPERVNLLVVIEGALLAQLAEVYRSEDWEGWPYVVNTTEQLLGEPIPEEHHYDLDYLFQQLIKIPIMYGPAKGMMRDEEVVYRVMDVLRPMWKGDGVDHEMTFSHLSRLRCETLLLYEANSVFRNAYEALRQHLPHYRSILLPAGNLKHFAGLEQPALILQHMKTFLASESLSSQA